MGSLFEKGKGSFCLMWGCGFMGMVNDFCMGCVVGGKIWMMGCWC